jgi:CSLREA domain-containing protein
MHVKSAVVCATAFALVAVLAMIGESWPRAQAGTGTTITVTNTLDDLAPGNGCSLREAIENANEQGAPHPDCAVGAGLGDLIVFNLGTGTPKIDIVSPLPHIIQLATIDGHTGQSDRVELHGPGGPFQDGFNGLHIGALAAGTEIRNLVINSFPVVGIQVDASNVSILGNRIGTDATGTVAMGNAAGIDVYGTGVQIGSANGTTPGGPCTGDCNLVSGNNNGILLRPAAANPVVRGNFIGTNLAGTADLGNLFTGLSSGGQAGVQIGGIGAGEGNLVSGNDGGIIANGPAAHVIGNRIGTNAVGDEAIPNYGIGLEVRNAAGGLVQDNLISGNGSHGLFIVLTSGVHVRDNLIGVAQDGTTELGNGGNGVWIATATDNLVGGSEGDANTIAFNGMDGVQVDAGSAPTTGNTILANSIHDNGGLGIANVDGGNTELTPPVITGLGSVLGTACANCTIDIYSDDEDEGRIYEGSTTADGGGNWTFNDTPVGPFVTATATDAAGNTSEFSSPFELTPATPTPTPSPTPSPTPTATPTPTTATPTATPTGTTTPSSTPTPTPTPTPTGALTELTWGDGDCGGAVNLGDAIGIARHLVSLPVNQEDECPALGSDVIVGGTDRIWQDIDCSGGISLGDAIGIARHLVSLPVNKPEECPDIGDMVSG